MDNNMRITNEVLDAKLSNAIKSIDQLNVRFESFAGMYARNDLLELRFKELDTRLAAIDLRIVEVASKSSRANWRTHTLTAVFTAGLIILVGYVFNDVIGG